MSERVIGLALSGGGSRAAAFELGCLRALHDLDLLDRVRVVSGISGGALLAALWAYGPADFAEFDEMTTGLLRRGLLRAIARRALRPVSLGSGLVDAAVAAVPGSRRLRHATRTDALADALSNLAFGGRVMSEVTHPGLDVVLTATDLMTSNVVRFGSAHSSCSRYGTILEPVRVATAVAASAAYPLFLPAIERQYTFERGSARRMEPVLLTDGGVYDNLALSVLEPGRESRFSPHVYPVPYIVSCDAGRGQLALRAPHFLPTRMTRAFEIVYRRAQDAGRSRLHEWAASGRIDGFVMAYLGMRDDALPVPVADLIPRERVAQYKTNFSAMSDRDLRDISTRGEQLVRTLLPVYCPRLL